MLNFPRFFELIEEKGVTKSFLCEKIGKSRGAINDWARGKSYPKTDDLEIIADLLDTTVDYLLGKTDKKNKPTVDDDNELLKLLENPDIADLMRRFDTLNEQEQDMIIEMARMFSDKHD